MRLNFAELHKNLWDWLTKNPEKEKCHWPGWDDIDYPILDRCFACEAALRLAPVGYYKCHDCPLIWPNGDLCNYPGGSLYNCWIDSKGDLEQRSRFAKKIADATWYAQKFFIIDKDWIYKK